VLFSVVGTFLLLLGLGVIHPSGARAPLHVLLAVGAVFFAAGLLLLVQGFKDIQLQKRLQTVVPTEGREPWRWDHAWDQAGTGPDTWRRISQEFGFAVFLAVFMVPFHWWAFFSGQGPWPIKIGTLFMDLVVIYLLGKTISDLLGLYAYGLHRLTFERFPFFMGSRLNVSVERPQAFARCQKVTATLRCIQVDWQSLGTSSNAGTAEQALMVYEDSKSFSSMDLQSMMAGFTLQFELPPGDYGNRLLDRYARYWELELTGEGGWKKFKAVYLLPVYDNPASSKSQEAAASAVAATGALSAEDSRVKTQLIGFLGLLAGIFLTITTPFEYSRYHRIVATWPLVQAQLTSKDIGSEWSYSNHSRTLVYFLDLQFRVLPNGTWAVARSPVRSSRRRGYENQLGNWQVGTTYALRQHPQKPGELSLIVTDQDVWRLVFPWVIAAFVAWSVYAAVAIRSKKARPGPPKAPAQLLKL